MQISFKYVLETSPMNENFELWKKGFFANKFEKFLDGELMIFLSNQLSDGWTIFQLDIDYKKEESNTPDGDAMLTYKKLIKIFGKNSFNLELSPNGVHIVSNFIYKRQGTQLETKKLVSHLLDNIRNLDIDASFSPTPLKRIGYDDRRDFFYAPVNVANQMARENLFTHVSPRSKKFWRKYIENLVPKRKISFYKFAKLLSNFHEERE